MPTGPNRLSSLRSSGDSPKHLSYANEAAALASNSESLGLKSQLQKTLRTPENTGYEVLPKRFSETGGAAVMAPEKIILLGFNKVTAAEIAVPTLFSGHGNFRRKHRNRPWRLPLSAVEYRAAGLPLHCGGAMGILLFSKPLRSLCSTAGLPATVFQTAGASTLTPDSVISGKKCGRFRRKDW